MDDEQTWHRHAQQREVTLATLSRPAFRRPGAVSRHGRIEEVACGELRADSSWNAVATEQEDVMTDGGARPETVKDYDVVFGKAYAVASDDFKPLATVTRRREQRGSRGRTPGRKRVDRYN